MKTYIINLKTSFDRRDHMKHILSTINFIDPDFIDAIDGRLMSVEEKFNLFDIDGFYKELHRFPLPGEIGCTLSHQKCYKRLMESGAQSCLILEDDIVINGDLERVLLSVNNFLDCDEPRLVLLSGWYWFSRCFMGPHDIKYAKVIDGFLTHSYALNKDAAKLMIEEKPHILADNWKYYQKKGVKIYGIRPHVIDQDWGGEISSIILSDGHKTVEYKFYQLLKIKVVAALRKLFQIIGHMERPQNFEERLHLEN